MITAPKPNGSRPFAENSVYKMPASLSDSEHLLSDILANWLGWR